MRILFVHQNAPGQFRNTAGALAKRGHDVVLVGQHQRAQIEGATYRLYEPGNGTPPHHYLKDLNAHADNGRKVFDLVRELAAEGWIPELVIGHAGWGEMLFIKDAIPQARTVGYFEFFYRSSGQDMGFDPEFQANAEDKARLRTRNLTNFLSLDAVDRGVTPTNWQKSVYPSEWHDKLNVIHDGIDTDFMAPGNDNEVPFRLPNGDILPPDAPIVSFVARNLEPYRGFHTFLRALPEILDRLPEIHVVIVGGNDVSYGRRPSGAKSWKEALLREVNIDTGRVSFVERLTYSQLRALFRVTAAHVYLSYPFVLSWSLLEVMACGALVIASRTAPVMEVVKDDVNGLLFGFFDTHELVSSVVRAVRDPKSVRPHREAARRTICEQYSFKDVCFPKMMGLLNEVARCSL